MWDWLGEALAVDFANTTKRSGGTEQELLERPEDLVAWAGCEAGRVPLVDAEAVRLGELRTLRDDVKALLHATVRCEPAPVPAIERVNARVRAAPLVPQLRGGEAMLAPAADFEPLDELLSRVAHSAIELSAAGGVGFCDAPSCGQFFERRRVSQLWCSDACGTRARVARHAHRRRA
ncbi:MAG TPA: ABATE domain-containing protein [Solirubrobacter sp.]|nr:ABATE domain-containing protein [Solirubrobacter sp.]